MSVDLQQMRTIKLICTCIRSCRRPRLTHIQNGSNIFIPLAQCTINMIDAFQLKWRMQLINISAPCARLLAGMWRTHDNVYVYKLAARMANAPMLMPH